MKDEQFIAWLVENFSIRASGLTDNEQAQLDLQLASVLREAAKKTFAHSDDRWRKKLLGLPADTADNIVDSGFGQAIIVSKEDIKSLFTDNETKI